MLTRGNNEIYIINLPRFPVTGQRKFGKWSAFAPFVSLSFCLNRLLKYLRSCINSKNEKAIWEKYYTYVSLKLRIFSKPESATENGYGPNFECLKVELNSNKKFLICYIKFFAAAHTQLAQQKKTDLCSNFFYKVLSSATHPKGELTGHATLKRNFIFLKLFVSHWPQRYNNLLVPGWVARSALVMKTGNGKSAVLLVSKLQTNCCKICSQPWLFSFGKWNLLCALAADAACDVLLVVEKRRRTQTPRFSTARRADFWKASILIPVQNAAIFSLSIGKRNTGTTLNKAQHEYVPTQLKIMPNFNETSPVSHIFSLFPWILFNWYKSISSHIC